jgi:hypothetical protein
MALAVLVTLAGCGGEPPEALQGFRLGMLQTELMAEANSRPGFVCRLVASRPKATFCAGPTDQGRIEAMARGDSTVRITLELAREAEDPARAVRDFTKGFGRPAWRDRPYPPASDPPEGYHTYWVDADSTRGIALLCRGPELEPPCNARLGRTSPAGVQAKLDSLMNIRR